MATTAKTEKPLGVAIVICDRVITEAQTNNKTIVCTFNQIHAKQFPCKHDRITVFVALTNGNGLKKIELVFRNDAEVIMKLGGKIEFKNPNHVVELIFNIKNCLFPKAGLYAFEVFADDEYVFESRFNALLKTAD